MYTHIHTETHTHSHRQTETHTNTHTQPHCFSRNLTQLAWLCRLLLHVVHSSFISLLHFASEVAHTPGAARRFCEATGLKLELHHTEEQLLLQFSSTSHIWQGASGLYCKEESPDMIRCRAAESSIGSESKLNQARSKDLSHTFYTAEASKTDIHT